MGLPVLIYGKSGAGKSRSTKNFNEDEIFYVDVEQKPLPFRKKFKYRIVSDDVRTIKNALSQMDPKYGVKTAIIDDAGLIMTHIFMARHRNMKGNQQFEMYNDIADDFYSIISHIKCDLPEDNIVYLMMHEDTDDDGGVKLKTMGKLLDQKCPLTERVTICIRCQSVDGEHYFRVVTDGSDVTKAPEEMFEKEEFENDLKVVDMAIRNFYGWEVKKTKSKEDK